MNWPSAPTSSSSRPIPTLPPLLADPVLLQRVLVNVLSNASATAPAGTLVRISTSRLGRHAQIRVVDHGAGVALERRDDIFAPFQRLGDTDNTTGLGLGLALSRGFVEGMGGTLTPEDTPGGGLTMVIELPVAADAPRLRARVTPVRAWNRPERRPNEDPHRRRRPPARARAAHHTQRAWLRDRGRTRRTCGHRPRRADASGSRPAGSRDAASRRRRRHRGAPGLDERADPRRLRAHRVRRQGGGAGCRSRRLRDEAVPDRRAPRAAARPLEARRCGRRRARRLVRRRERSTSRRSR